VSIDVLRHGSALHGFIETSTARSGFRRMVLMTTLAPPDAVPSRVRSRGISRDPLTIAEVSGILRLPQRPLYRRLEMLLKRLREALTAGGIAARDAVHLIGVATREMDFAPDERERGKPSADQSSWGGSRSRGGRMPLEGQTGNGCLDPQILTSFSARSRTTSSCPCSRVRVPGRRRLLPVRKDGPGTGTAALHDHRLLPVGVRSGQLLLLSVHEYDFTFSLIGESYFAEITAFLNDNPIVQWLDGFLGGSISQLVSALTSLYDSIGDFAILLGWNTNTGSLTLYVLSNNSDCSSVVNNSIVDGRLGRAGTVRHRGRGHAVRKPDPGQSLAGAQQQCRLPAVHQPTVLLLSLRYAARVLRLIVARLVRLADPCGTRAAREAKQLPRRRSVELSDVAWQQKWRCRKESTNYAFVLSGCFGVMSP
jgi:hypothetical protein